MVLAGLGCYLVFLVVNVDAYYYIWQLGLLRIYTYVVGLCFVLDGLTYRYSGGYSLFSSRPKTFLISAIVSVGGWFYFEYFDYFALGNWYYPNTAIPGLSHT